MPEDLITALSQASQYSTAAGASSNGTAGSTTRGNVTQPSNPILDALTDRLEKQGKGISSSASSGLQDSINEAIQSSERAGRLGSQALQSEREREVAFARDRAGATYTAAMEGQSGYAMQVAGLRELTETTEKSVRYIDKRYQEAILQNDSATASRLADLRIKKLEFQQNQENQYYANLFQAAGLYQTSIGQQMQSEQFYAKSEQDERQFMMNLAQSDYQFQKNLGIQYKELDLKTQQLDIERSKFNLSAQEYREKKKELDSQKNYTTTQALIGNRLQMMAASGALAGMDKLSIAENLRNELGDNFDGGTEDFNYMVFNELNNINMADIPTVMSNNRVGGAFGSGGAFTPIGAGARTAGSLLNESLFGVVPGQQSTASQVNWSDFARSMGKANASLISRGVYNPFAF